MAASPVVCIVDDDESVRESLSAWLRSVGLDARPFASAEDFLSSGLAAVSDCAVIDVTMPGMSGTVLQERLLAMGLSIPVVFITARTEPTLHARLLERGALVCLVKPFREDDLLDAVTKAIRVAAAIGEQSP